ncbi:MAG: NADH-quinone oxidoreductase subunit NuoF [Lentisphaerae bacterium]|nr:NADH-quinone oxidoreductase subunit NuoF [Lentisphaerota bacterium]MCP4103382.1 NADH-quinone oxidoreductase subunit NuoF [Lentisphaerota bacterium]
MIDSVDKLTQRTADLQGRTQAGTQILVSMGTCGVAAGAAPVLDALKSEIANRKLENAVKIVETGCMGLCHCEPSIEILDSESNKSFTYGKVKPEDAGKILDNLKDIAAGMTTVDRTWYYPELEENTENKIQARIVLKNSGRINPEILDDYLANDGYTALAKVLTKMQPQDVIDEITASGLRGRGGGGFPTGMKWSFAAAQKSDEKYMICNADEGDPGAFMDRAVLEGDPHAVLEAMAIAGYAIGANHGIIYIRAEYPLAIQRLQIAIAQAEEEGLLGDNIFGSGFNFKLELKYGAGAFVCGEETALIHSIEGKRGEPTFKPPFPAVSGLWKKPTIVNNVETYANVPAIIRRGAGWFKGIGTEKSAGTKVFALAGKVKDVGLVEVPMGTKLRDIIFGLGGGIEFDKKFKAVQTGGPSGGCIKADKLDTPIDYDNLIALGSMMGSGGMIVMDEDDCMVNIAKFFLEFTLDESCGKCTPCRVGNKRLYEMLEEICEGKGTMETLNKLRNLSHTIKDTALCGLGQTSPNPILSTMINFEDEYLAHVQNHSCPAGVCTKLITYEINDNCVGCTLCARNCPVDCISGERKGLHVIDQSKCIKCGVCYSACKFHAIDRK